MYKFSLTLVLSVLFVSVVSADDYIDLVNKGNKAFSEKKYSEALDFYHSAEPQLPESSELDYNLAGALHQKADYKEAIEKYTKALNNTTDLNLEAQTHYNLANTHFQMGDYQEAITSYQNSLMINPEDLDAKYNLELSRKMLKEQMKNQENKQDQQEQNKDQQDQEKKQGEQDQQGDQEKKDSDQGQEQKDKEDKGDKKSEAQKQKEAEQKAAEKRKRQELAGEKMSKEDAERILNGIKDAEEKQQKRLRQKRYNQNDYNGNDW